MNRGVTLNFKNTKNTINKFAVNRGVTDVSIYTFREIINLMILKVPVPCNVLVVYLSKQLYKDFLTKLKIGRIIKIFIYFKLIIKLY